MSDLTAVSRTHTRTLTQIALCVSLLTLCTWIAIPTAVPFTMQTFAVFAVLGLLGGRHGTFAIVCYLLIGLVGLPVFSGFRGGAAVLLGNTGGYLIGFVCMGLLFWLFERLWGKSLPVMALSMLLGLLVLYLFGTLWYQWIYAAGTGGIGFVSVLTLCVFPFVLPDLVKLALALLVVRRLAPYLPRISNNSKH